MMFNTFLFLEGEKMNIDIMIKDFVIESVEFKESNNAEKYVNMKEGENE